jgi:hypothetical protein
MTDRTKTIFRIIKNAENPFVMMDKRALMDPALTYKAKGILAYLLSRPDNWTINISDVINHSPDGEYAVRSGVKELIDAGYVRRIPERDEKKRIVRWIMEVYEQPMQNDENDQAADLDRGNLNVGFPDVGNLALNNTDSNKKEPMGASAPARPATQEFNLEERILAFPTDCQSGAKLMVLLFNLRLPEKPKPDQKGGEYAKWINGLRELNKIASEYNTPLDAALKATWKRFNQNPFTVTHPGALAKTMLSTLASQTQSNENPAPIQSALEQTLKNFTPRR